MEKEMVWEDDLMCLETPTLIVNGDGIKIGNAASSSTAMTRVMVVGTDEALTVRRDSGEMAFFIRAAQTLAIGVAIVRTIIGAAGI